MLLSCGVGEDSWESLRWQGDPTIPEYFWKDWYWSWNSNTLAIWWEELTHWKRPWCWERLKVGGEGDDRGWNGWMASLTLWTWVWVSSGSWWWTGRPGVLQSVESQRVGHDWVTELNWNIHILYIFYIIYILYIHYIIYICHIYIHISLLIYIRYRGFPDGGGLVTKSCWLLGSHGL